MAGLMYRLGSPCVANDVVSFGLLCITTLVTCGDINVQLYWSYPNICV